jgi:hypothetical protein
LPLWVRPQDSPCNAPIHFGGLHNKHGNYRDEHRCRGKGYDDPTQAGTGLTLNEFTVGLPTMLYINPSGKIVYTVSGVIPEAVMLKYIEVYWSFALRRCCRQHRLQPRPRGRLKPLQTHPPPSSAPRHAWWCWTCW